MDAAKRLLVVGGSSGIGLATARMAALQGAQVIIAGRDRTRLDKAAASIDGQVAAHAFDASDGAQVEAAFATIGEVDWLLATQAAIALGPFRELPVETAMLAMNVKFWGMYRVMRAARFARGGAAVLVSGLWSERPTPGAAHMAAVNSAVEGLGRALAVELSPLRVNVVSPGIVRTPIYDAMPESQRAAFFESVAASAPARRVADAEDVARAVLFLLSNPNMSGEVLHVDAGSRLV